MAKVNVKEFVKESLSTFLDENGYELYNLEFVKEGKDRFLRVFVDKLPYGQFMGTDDCEKISRYLSEKLDRADPIEENYYLEVSSPGLDRKLIKEQDYVRFLGSAVEITLYQSISGKKKYEGTLTGLVDGVVTLKDQVGNQYEFPLEQIAKSKLSVVF